MKFRLQPKAKKEKTYQILKHKIEFLKREKKVGEVLAILSDLDIEANSTECVPFQIEVYLNIFEFIYRHNDLE